MRAEPVILVHAEYPAGSGWAACSGETFTTPEADEYPRVPRQPCPGCFGVIPTRLQEWKDRARERSREAGELTEWMFLASVLLHKLGGDVTITPMELVTADKDDVFHVLQLPDLTWRIWTDKEMDS